MTVQPDGRLAAAASFVRQGAVAADIGCDHGKLSIYLVQSGRCPRVVAADVRPAPLAVAQKNAAAAGVADKIAFRLADGLTAVQPEEVTDIVLAGLSGLTIWQLLTAAPWTQNERYNFVFVPATRDPELRASLAANGYSVQREICAVAAGRTYAVMQVSYTGERRVLTLSQSIVGGLAGQAGADAYFTARLHHLQRTLLGAKAEDKPALQSAIQTVTEVIRQCP